jgi:type IV secretory pathway VirB2 component (pilin)
LPPLSVSSQGSSKTNAALPGTYDEFLKQNAAQEKTGESVQTLAVLVIVLLGAMWLCRKWFLRR